MSFILSNLLTDGLTPGSLYQGPLELATPAALADVPKAELEARATGRSAAQPAAVLFSFFETATRQPVSRANESPIVAIHGVMADLDCKVFFRANYDITDPKGLADDITKAYEAKYVKISPDAQRKVLSLPMPPTHVAFSAGGGARVYWEFDEPLPIPAKLRHSFQDSVAFARKFTKLFLKKAGLMPSASNPDEMKARTPGTWLLSAIGLPPSSWLSALDPRSSEPSQRFYHPHNIVRVSPPAKKQHKSAPSEFEDLCLMRDEILLPDTSDSTVEPSIGAGGDGRAPAIVSALKLKYGQVLGNYADAFDNPHRHIPVFFQPDGSPLSALPTDPAGNVKARSAFVYPRGVSVFSTDCGVADGWYPWSFFVPAESQADMASQIDVAATAFYSNYSNGVLEPPVGGTTSCFLELVNSGTGDERLEVRTRAAVTHALAARGLSHKIPKGCTVSPIDAALHEIDVRRRIVSRIHEPYASWCVRASSAGHFEMNTAHGKFAVLEPSVISSDVSPARHFPVIANYLSAVFGPNALNYFLRHIQISYTSCRNGSPVRGHATFICGPKSSGKTQLIDNIVAPLHRAVLTLDNSSRGVVGAGNGEFLVASGNQSQWTNTLAKDYILKIDDVAMPSTIRLPGGVEETPQQVITQRIRQYVASGVANINEKGGKNYDIVFTGRLFFLFNPDRREDFIPEWHDDIVDKFHLFTVSPIPQHLVMPTREAEEAVARELPWFAAWLLRWKAPDILDPAVCGERSKFLMRSYHDPELAALSAHDQGIAQYCARLETVREALVGPLTTPSGYDLSEIQVIDPQHPTKTMRLKDARSRGLKAAILDAPSFVSLATALGSPSPGCRDAYTFVARLVARWRVLAGKFPSVEVMQFPSRPGQFLAFSLDRSIPTYQNHTPPTPSAYTDLPNPFQLP